MGRVIVSSIALTVVSSDCDPKPGASGMTVVQRLVMAGTHGTFVSLGTPLAEPRCTNR